MVYNEIIGVWGHQYGLSIPNIALVARTHRPKKSTLKFFLPWFLGSKMRFFHFSSIEAILSRGVNIGFLGTFRGPKGRFPAKNHISGHYIKKYRFLKNRIFWHFLWVLRILLMRLVAEIGRKWTEIYEIVKNVFLRLFRCVFVPMASIYDI